MGTMVNCPIYGGVLIMEVLYVGTHARDSNGTEQWCPVRGGGGCILEVSFN